MTTNIDPENMPHAMQSIANISEMINVPKHTLAWMLRKHINELKLG